MDKKADHQGGCLCGAVRYRVEGAMRPVIACHCSQCRRATGSFMMASAAMHDHLTIEGAENITWYNSSDTARRGFCRICGSNLFWEGAGRPHTSITAGSLDGPTGLSLGRHIFVADKGDYYEIADNVAQSQTFEGYDPTPPK
ncbi:GFA family protein [Dongia sp.]|uniref:GFA family protein n=1 Tax=Dongia sp. TaxID=1977262 RepID=UPI0035B169DF